MTTRTIKYGGSALLLALITALTSCKADRQVELETLSPAYGNSEAEPVIMTLQTLDTSRLDDLDEVMAAINVITVPEIGVKVVPKVINSLEAFSQYSLWISNEETVDLMMLNYQDITAYTSRGMLLPLDQLLLEEAPDICYIMEEEGYALTEGAVIQDVTYGIATVQEKGGSGGGIWLPERYLKEAEITYDPRHVYSLDELGAILKRLKEIYPDKYPLGQITSGNAYSTMSYYRRVGDGLGSDGSTGILLEEGGNLIGNLYATDYYYDFLEHLREWYLAGYIYPDAAFTDADLAEIISSGIVMSYPLASMPGMGLEDAFGEKVVCLRTTEVTSGAQYTKAGFWTIPITSSNPKAAMRFLNMMYGDGRISNLISLGIEGKHYVVTDRENRLIQFPEGQSMATVGYYNPLGLYGDMRKNYSQGTVELRKAQQEYSEEALSHPMGARGFIFSTANVDKQINAVQKVLEKYFPILESGSVDLDLYYPEFLKELELAGMDQIIAEKQAQFDEWSRKKQAEEE